MKTDCFTHTIVIKTEENKFIYLFLNVAFTSNFQHLVILYRKLLI